MCRCANSSGGLEDEGHGERNVCREVQRQQNASLSLSLSRLLSDAPLFLLEVKMDDLGLSPSSTGGKKKHRFSQRNVVVHPPDGDGLRAHRRHGNKLLNFQDRIEKECFYAVHSFCFECQQGRRLIGRVKRGPQRRCFHIKWFILEAAA